MDLSLEDLGKRQVPSSLQDLGSREVPKNTADLGQPEAVVPSPNPIPTSHTYDAAITKAASSTGLDPRILQAVGMQETRLGTGGGYDPKTGRDTGGNQAVSPFQLDPASGLPKEVLDRAAKDPSFAASLSAKMLQRNMKLTNGNLREALSMYNSGSRHSQVGLAYADSVLNFMNKDQPLLQHHDLVTKLQSDFHRVKTALQHNKPLGKALAHTQTFHDLHKAEVRGAESWDWARQHPIGAVLDILGTPQRAVGGAIEEAVHPDNATFKQHLQHVWDYVFNPTEKNQEKTTGAIGEVVNKITGKHIVPTHSDIDSYVRGQVHTPEAIKPYIEGLLKAGTDFTEQTLTDPLMVDSIGRGLVNVGLHGIEALNKAAHATASAMGIGQYFDHLTTGIHKGLADTFVARRDLDKAGFTAKGKKVRLAVENAELNKAEKDFAANRTAAKSVRGTQEQYLQYVYQHGSAQKSAQAAAGLGSARHPSPTGHMIVGDIIKNLHKFSGMDEGEREKVLNSIRNNIARKEVNKQTEALHAAHPDLGKVNLKGVGLEDNSAFFRGLKSVEKNNPLTKLADLGKRAILWNPMPHGLVNVGTLAYQAGGIPSIMRAFSYMADKTDPRVLNRLREMGALSEYSNTAKTVIGQKSNDLLHKMEYGWRAGLLDELDRKLGKSVPGSVEEYLKGHMISNHVGDYRNQSAFVQMFRALGGPFVAFRLGIVPEQFFRTLKENPSRILSQVRTVEDIQANRRGKKKNEVVMGGPTEDVGKLLTDPRAFFASPSTSGALGEFLASPSTPHGGILENSMNLAKAYIPGASDIIKLGEIAQGSTMPGQKMSLVDKLMGTIEEEFLNMYFKKQESKKQLKASKGRLKKQVTI